MLIPLASLILGFKRAWYGERFHKEELVFKIFDGNSLPFAKFLEYVGEALPQLIIALLFLINNYTFVYEQEKYLGINVPLTVISIIFSSGSLACGLYSVFRMCNYHVLLYSLLR